MKYISALLLAVSVSAYMPTNGQYRRPVPTELHEGCDHGDETWEEMPEEAEEQPVTELGLYSDEAEDEDDYWYPEDDYWYDDDDYWYPEDDEYYEEDDYNLPSRTSSYDDWAPVQGDSYDEGYDSEPVYDSYDYGYPSRSSSYDDWAPIDQGNYYGGDEYGYSGQGFYDTNLGGVHGATNDAMYQMIPDYTNYASQEYQYGGNGYYDSRSGNVYGGIQQPVYQQPTYQMPSYSYTRLPSRSSSYDDWAPMQSGSYGQGYNSRSSYGGYGRQPSRSSTYDDWAPIQSGNYYGYRY